MKNITTPKSGGGTQAIHLNRNMIIVGANGAGKTRFGSWLEQKNNPTRRISAQRYLQLAEAVSKQDYTTAENNLRGSFKNQSPIQPQNDYQQLMVSLFAQESKRDSDYVALAKMAKDKPDVPKSVKEAVVEVWNFIFPYRAIKLENDRVRAVSDQGEFSGAEMSEGEKVGLYLISQVLLAEPNCILIVDEPELHLHKALMVRLWNKLEQERSDCSFIYITHDLDFAASKSSDKLIWIRNFKNGNWDWEDVDPNNSIPENLFLEILGSRKPIIFVEGDKGSLDSQLYQAFYEGFTVIPCGSCSKVIEAVRGLKNHPSLHQNKVAGIIDRDFRGEEEIKSLKADGIYCLAVSEVENLFLCEEILNLVCTHLNKSDQQATIIAKIKEIFNSNKISFQFLASKNQIHRHLGEKFGQVKDKDAFEEFKKTILGELDVIFSKNVFPEGEMTLEKILVVYPHKGLINQVQGILELSKSGYKNQVFGLFTSANRPKVVEALKKYLPTI